jgi:hypothetical protein
MRILERAIQQPRVDSIVKDHRSRRFTLLDASDWIEWAGRGVGAGWIALGIIESVYRNAM